MIAPFRFNLWLIFVWLCMCAGAQDLSITGNVEDITGAPIEFANVVLLDTETQNFITGTSTNQDGIFTLSNLNPGNYTIKISYIGFVTYKQKLILDGQLNLQRIQLSESSERLDQVEIIAKKPTVTRKPDRLIFNVENTALTQGSTLSVLRNTPGVIVGEGAINIKSSEAVIYINERRVQLTSEELLQLLDSAPANSIQSVEVITNPPASYDADSGSVINIVMSKNLVTGYRGSVNTGYTQGVFPRYELGTNHYFKNDKVNFNLNYNYKDAKINRTNDDTVNYLDDLNAINEIWSSDINRNTWSETHNLNLNFDYYLSDKSTLSITSTGLYMPYFKYKIKNSTTITDPQNQLISSFAADNLSRDTKYNIGTDVSFAQNFDNEAKLTVNAHYTNYNYDRNQNVVSNFFDNNNSFLERTEFNTLANQDTEIITGRIDYNLPLDESSEFSAGLKYGNVKTESEIIRLDVINGEESIDPDNSDAFEYDEKVYAVYGNYSKSWDNWDLTLGLRVEQTNIDGLSLTLNETNTQDYLNWFPNISLSHQISDNLSIYGNYKRSITRPNYTNLNPFTFFLNENLVVVGNPELVPTYMDYFEIGTDFLKYFRVMAYYRTFDGEIEELPRQDNATNILAYTPINLDNTVDYGFDFSFNMAPTNWWYVYALTSYYNFTQETNFDDGFVSLSQWSSLTMIQNSFRFLKDRSLSIGFYFEYWNTNLSQLALVGTRITTSLNISKTLFNKRATVSLAVEDLFNRQDYQVDTEYLNQLSSGIMDLDNRFVTLGFRYNFGNTGLSSNERSISAEERDRIKDLD